MVTVASVSPLTLDDKLHWQVQINDAITEIARGEAKDSHWRVIFDACNLVKELVAMGIAEDPAGIWPAAQNACVAILDRQRDTGVRAVRAGELAALRTLVQAWADLMDGITHQQKFDAEQRVADRVARVLRKKTPASDTRIVVAPASITEGAPA